MVNKESLVNLNSKLAFYVEYFKLNDAAYSDIDASISRWEAMTRLYTRIIPVGDIYSLSMECFQRKHVDMMSKVASAIQMAVNYSHQIKNGDCIDGFENVFRNLDKQRLGNVYRQVYEPVEQQVNNAIAVMMEDIKIAIETKFGRR